MHALVLERIAADFSGCTLKEVPKSVPAQDEVCIRVKAAALNFPDLLQTKGLYQTKYPLPFILGMEIAGDIVAIGRDVSGWSVGDSVLARSSDSAMREMSGGFAEFTTSPAKLVSRMPVGLTYAQAASFNISYNTAFVALKQRGQLQTGQWLLVQGAAGAAGLAAVDLGLRLGGRVIAASASGEKLRQIRAAFNPHFIIDSGVANFVEQVLQITHGNGVDIVFDPVGGEVTLASMRCMSFEAKLILIGFASGSILNLSTKHILAKGLNVIGVRASAHGRHNPVQAREARETLWKMVEQVELRPQVDKEYPLHAWREAFGRMDARAAIGKIILRPDLKPT